MDQLPVSGSLTTESKDPNTYVTDSAAGASAWATGEKTYNGAISVDLDGNPLPILGEQARQAGKATGLVTTAQVTDATPAAFFSQTANRNQQDDIARQYLEESRPSVILGGGEDWWYPRGQPGAYPDQPAEDPSEASRGTKGNLVAEAQRRGYTYASTPDELAAAKGRKVLGLFSNEEMFQQRSEGKGDVYDPVVPLSTMTSKALSILSKDKQGFFLVVEEEGIDEFAHANNAEKMLYSMKQLEAAVAVARRYVASHPDTLLIITGDHETGGLTVEDNRTSDESGDGVSAEDGPFPIRGSNKTFTIDWTTGSHSNLPVPITAAGPGALEFTGQHPNTYVHDVLSRVLR
jgi:alkaline phosphatase